MANLYVGSSYFITECYQDDLDTVGSDIDGTDAKSMYVVLNRLPESQYPTSTAYGFWTKSENVNYTVSQDAFWSNVTPYIDEFLTNLDAGNGADTDSLVSVDTSTFTTKS